MFFMELVHDASVLIERMVLPSVGPGWNHGTECPVLCPHSRGVIRDGSKISRWGGRSSFCGGNGGQHMSCRLDDRLLVANASPMQVLLH